MRCVLVGNYGAGNVGDEALREYFLRAFPQVDWTVVSARVRRAEETPRLPFGLRSLFHPWWKTLQAIKACDAVIFGGGTLFTDIESLSACVMWGRYAGAARVQGKQYFLAFQGVGPFKTQQGEAIARRVYEGASFISVRDKESFERIKKWNLSCEPVLTSDPAVALFASYRGAGDQGKRLVFVPRTNSGQSFFDAVEAEKRQAWDSVRVLLMQPDARERGIAEHVKRAFPSADIVDIRSVRHLLEEMSGAKTVVTERYHGALAALSLGKKTVIIPQAEGDKLWALRKGVQSGETDIGQRLQSIEDGAKALSAAFTLLRKQILCYTNPMNTLYLTTEERALFDALPEEVKEGWFVEDETIEFADTMARKKMRFELLHLTDPVLRDLKKKAQKAATPDEQVKVLRSLDFSKIGDKDFSRLLFALGPDSMSLAVADIFSRVESKNDMELIAALAGLRHLMLEALLESDF